MIFIFGKINLESEQSQFMEQSTILLPVLIFIAVILASIGVWIYVAQIAQEPVPITVVRNNQKIAKQAEPSVTTQTEPEKQIQPEDETADWQTCRNKEYGFEFRYPNDFLWQDNIEIVAVQNYDAANFGQTLPCVAPYSGEKISSQDNIYWRCQFDDGAAGSTYRNYEYVGLSGDSCFALKFVVRYTHCGVYGSSDEPAYQQCEIDNQQKDETIKTIESTFVCI